jgi:outer membrane protein
MVQGVLTIPIYQGGGEYATIRQSKEQFSQARLIVDQQRLAVRAAILTAWSQVQTTKDSISVLKNAVTAAEMALAGVREEAKIGQRTTNDILNSQQTLLIARTNLIDAEHDHILAIYALAQADGSLDAKTLRLDTQLYDPGIHFKEIDFSWIGTGPALKNTD